MSRQDWSSVVGASGDFCFFFFTPPPPPPLDNEQKQIRFRCLPSSLSDEGSFRLSRSGRDLSFARISRTRRMRRLKIRQLARRRVVIFCEKSGRERERYVWFFIATLDCTRTFLLAFANNFKYISISLQVCALVIKKQTLYLLSLCNLCHLCGRDNEGLNIQAVQLHAINYDRLHSAKADFFLSSVRINAESLSVTFAF